MKNSTRNLFKITLAAPLALAVAACGGDAEDVTGGDVIEPIAAPDGTNWGDTVTISEEDGYVLGNPDAPLKLVEYASHTCGGCANFAVTGKPGVKDYVATGVVSFEQRNLVRDPIDLTIAALVRCGAKENMQVLSDQAWQDFNGVMTNVQAAGPQIQAANELPIEQRFVRFAEVSGLIDFFAARGLSADQQRECLADSETIEAIAENSSEQARELNIQSTPTFILNGRTLDERSWDDLEVVLQNAGARQE